MGDATLMAFGRMIEERVASILDEEPRIAKAILTQDLRRPAERFYALQVYRHHMRKRQQPPQPTTP